MKSRLRSTKRVFHFSGDKNYVNFLLVSERNVALIGEEWQTFQFDIKWFDFLSRPTYHESIDPLQDIGGWRRIH